MIGNNLMILVDYEMLENEHPNTAKQDCERNAAKCLLLKIKKYYLRLKILLIADALYAKQVIMGLCEKNH